MLNQLDVGLAAMLDRKADQQEADERVIEGFMAGLDSAHEFKLFCVWEAGVLDKRYKLQRDIRDQELMKTPPFECKYCGRPSWIDPSDQCPPATECWESDHGSAEDFYS